MTNKNSVPIEEELAELADMDNHIEDIEMHDQQYYLRTEEGKNHAKKVLSAVKKADILGDEYEAELMTNLETGGTDVRVVESSLCDVEAQVKKQMNESIEKYDK